MISDKDMKIVLEVVEGNPGAATVIGKMLGYPRWKEVVAYLKSERITGSCLWMLYKDKYKMDEMRIIEQAEEAISRKGV